MQDRECCFTQNQLNSMEDHDTRLQGFEKPLIYLVGSYMDAKGHSQEISNMLFSKLAKSPLRFHLSLFCCGQMNTGAAGQPLATSLAYDTSRSVLSQGHIPLIITAFVP